MKRDLQRLADEEFDLLVIGGGITGICVARDAALRGLNVALIEKNDFAHATSAHNSRLIHGGLRYLRNFEMRLVRESLRERRIWLRIAPGYVHPLPFLLPLYKRGWTARAMLSAGLSLYDALASDWRGDSAERLGRHRWLDAKAALAREPAIEAHGFDGAFEYYDAQMSSPERLALACAMDAAANGAVLANHLSADGLLLRDGRAEGARVTDAFGDAQFDVRAGVTLIAAGPWADLFLASVLGKPASHRLVRSKGIHLVVPAMTRTHALTVAANGGHFFVLPWRGHSLIGTTDAPFSGAPDDVTVDASDIDDLLDIVNANLPSARLRREQVRHSYAGLRPLLADGGGNTYAASRRAELIDHCRDDGVTGLLSAIGGKWTTSRHLAEQAVDAVVTRLGKTVRPCATAVSKIPAATVANGTEEQVLAAVREEMALTLDDVVMRRTGIGLLGNPGAAVLDRISRTMAAELGWDEARRLSEIAAVKGNFRMDMRA